jgi:SAM-dependent methyltransferase
MAQYRRLPATARLDGAPTTQIAHRSIGRSAASVALDPTRGDLQPGRPFRARVRVAIRDEAVRWRVGTSRDAPPCGTERHGVVRIRRVGLAAKLHYRLIGRLAPTHAKRRAELAYWKERQAEEGVLTNDWYVDSFTTAFGIDPSFYIGKRVLDIGCGPRGSLEWATMASERVGIDPLAKRYEQLNGGLHDMTYVAAKSEDMPFPEAHFDVVSSFNSLDHVDDLDATIREITRVTAPGGMFLLLVLVNHLPTRTEPLSFSWDVLTRFRGFQTIEERRLERVGVGVVSDAMQNVPYDDHGPLHLGTLAARLVRRPAQAPT